MGKKFLKPCECGESVLVDNRSVGIDVPCACGKTVLVATMSELRELKPAPEETQDKTKTKQWSAKRGAIFLGVAMILFGAVGFGLITSTIPTYPFPDEQTIAENKRIVSEEYDKLSLAQLMVEWEGIKRGLNKNPEPKLKEVLDYTKHANRPRFLAVLLMIAGGIVIIASFFLDKSPKPQKKA